MNDYQIREKVTKRIEYVIEAPVNLTELNKVIVHASQAFHDYNGRPVAYDDDLWMEPSDGEVIVWFEVKS